ncbi:Fe-S cluster assembly protein SufD [Microvirga mediterraneensis]|uniref:Fe-S cluster assembly protein SufD n=1 Tax=Microvirga mediterraneensis TaxID=2754695 RepID=A0A838BQ98_9HYPH|nr:Fe-S cluster assembly protein SufD [Microvirga mediterraneensis]MBA1157113.1 Fe-S cluster assembly protein SufD [Microvirga mediterraneensis]
MADVTLMKTPAETALVQAFESAKTALPGNGESRAQAFEQFNSRGLPHRRVEEFKYTDLRSLLREVAPFAGIPSSDEAKAALANAKALAGVQALQVPFVNGHFVRDAVDFHALPENLEIVPLAEALANGHEWLTRLSPVPWANDNPVYQLNTSFMADGVMIRVAGPVETPVHLRFVTAASSAIATATRVLVVVEEGASVTLLETHESTDGANHQPNDVVEMIAGDRTNVQHVRVNAEGDKALALSTLAAKIGGEAVFNSINVTAGSATSRHQVFAVLDGENTHLRVNGATMLKGSQHGDSTLVVEHGAPHCESRELFKTVIDNEATGVFQGKIIVPHHAQKTDGRMMSAALLLEEGGSMNNKPELEIFADDVQCAHGATCGQLDEDLLFYLMARGLPKKEAESLLVQAFLGESLEFVENETVREALVGTVEGWLKARA